MKLIFLACVCARSLSPIPSLNVMYDYSGLQTDINEANVAEDVQSLRTRLSNVTVRIKERGDMVNTILTNAARILNGNRNLRASFLSTNGGAKTDTMSIKPVDMNTTGDERESLLQLNQAASVVLKRMEKLHEILNATNSDYLMATTSSSADATPCGTQAECDSMADRANSCSLRRVKLLQAYEDVNKGVAVMGNMIATMCACIFADAIDLCFLAKGPPPVAYVCTIPYESYVGIFYGSKTMWDAVKTSTVMCSIIGSAQISTP